MKSFILATVLLGATTASALHAAQQPKLEALATYTFEDYVKAYGKTYATPEERARREAIFNDNLLMIRSHNAKADKTYTLNVNHMADWTPSQFKGVLGQIPARRRGLEGHLKSLRTTSETEKVALPDSVDWREKNVVSPVKDQGACGSCWAFAATETMESHWAIATGNLLQLSTQQVTSCTPNPDECGGKGGCEGATEVLAFEYAVKSGGIVAEASWPYGGYDAECKVPANAPRVANFTSFVRVKENDQEDMLQTVATKGPVTIGVWADPMMFYFGGVFSGCSYEKNMNVNHAVQLVGYGTEAGKDYWIVRNSWGASWGEKGYIRLLRESEPKCGLDKTPKDGSACKNDPDTPIKVCGQCGILSEAAYPIPQV